MKTVFHRLLRLLAAGAVALAGASIAHATSVTTISNNINGMRQLSGDNVVQQYPGAAPFFGPTACQEDLPSYQAKMGNGYNCACPNGATQPVCTPLCSVLLPQYQQAAGMNQSCTCPAPDQTPVCQPIACVDLIGTYQNLHAGDTCSCPAGAATPQCVPPQPTCAQMLPTYQQQYQAQQGAGVPVSCSCPNPSATTAPVCSCGSAYTGFWIFHYVNNAGNEYGMGMMFVDTYNNLLINGFSNLWTGSFTGNGSVATTGQLVGGRTTSVGATGSWTGSYTTSTASGSYVLDTVNTMNPPGCAANPMWCGTWTATKFGTFSNGCAAGVPPCGDALARAQATFSANGASCQCFAGTTAQTPPGCYYQSCQGAYTIVTGSWTFQVLNNGQPDTTCYGQVTSSSDTLGGTPGLGIQATCNSGDAFGAGQTPYQNSTNGDVSCSSTLGQNVPGYIGTPYSSTPVDGGKYWMAGTFTSPTTFSGYIIQNPALTVVGTKN